MKSPGRAWRMMCRCGVVDVVLLIQLLSGLVMTTANFGNRKLAGGCWGRRVLTCIDVCDPLVLKGSSRVIEFEGAVLDWSCLEGSAVKDVRASDKLEGCFGVQPENVKLEGISHCVDLGVSFSDNSIPNVKYNPAILPEMPITPSWSMQTSRAPFITRIPLLSITTTSSWGVTTSKNNAVSKTIPTFTTSEKSNKASIQTTSNIVSPTTLPCLLPMPLETSSKLPIVTGSGTTVTLPGPLEQNRTSGPVPTMSEDIVPTGAVLHGKSMLLFWIPIACGALLFIVLLLLGGIWCVRCWNLRRLQARIAALGPGEAVIRDPIQGCSLEQPSEEMNVNLSEEAAGLLNPAAGQIAASLA